MGRTAGLAPLPALAHGHAARGRAGARRRRVSRLPRELEPVRLVAGRRRRPADAAARAAAVRRLGPAGRRGARPAVPAAGRGGAGARHRGPRGPRCERGAATSTPSPSRSAARRCCAACRCASTPARAPRSSGPAAPARRRCCAPSPGSPTSPTGTIRLGERVAERRPRAPAQHRRRLPGAAAAAAPQRRRERRAARCARAGLRSASGARAAAALLEDVGLAAFADRRVQGLSGGEQQRVALARALCAEPDLLLLDEPLAALDPNRRESLRRLLVRLQEERALTMLIVTHDRAEAAELGQRVALMLEGRIVQEDEPRTLFERPVSAAVARFFGAVNLLRGDVLGGPARGWRGPHPGHRPRRTGDVRDPPGARPRRSRRADQRTRHRSRLHGRGGAAASSEAAELQLTVIAAPGAAPRAGERPSRSRSRGEHLWRLPQAEPVAPRDAAPPTSAVWDAQAARYGRQEGLERRAIDAALRLAEAARGRRRGSRHGYRHRAARARGSALAAADGRRRRSSPPACSGRSERCHRDGRPASRMPPPRACPPPPLTSSSAPTCCSCCRRPRLGRYCSRRGAFCVPAPVPGSSS